MSDDYQKLADEAYKKWIKLERKASDEKGKSVSLRFLQKWCLKNRRCEWDGVAGAVQVKDLLCAVRKQAEDGK